MVTKRNPDNPEDVTDLCWCGVRWIRGWSWLDDVWRDDDRLVRRT